MPMMELRSHLSLQRAMEMRTVVIVSFQAGMMSISKFALFYRALPELNTIIL